MYPHHPEYFLRMHYDRTAGSQHPAGQRGPALSLRGALIVLAAVAVMLSATMVGGLSRPAQAAPRAAGLSTSKEIIARHSGDCLTAQNSAPLAQLVTRRCDAIQTQLWALRSGGYYNGYEYFEVVNNYNGMCMDVRDAATGDWAVVQQGGCVGGGHANQLWRKQYVGAEYYRLIALHSARCLDIYYGWAIQYACNGGDQQRFRFV